MSTIGPSNSNAIESAFRKFDRASADPMSDPVRSAVDTKTAKYEVSANAAAIRTQDQNLGTILDMKA